MLFHLRAHFQNFLITRRSSSPPKHPARSECCFVHCCAACANDTACDLFVFNAGQDQCHIKPNLTLPGTRGRCTSGILRPKPVPGPTPSPTPPPPHPLNVLFVIPAL